MKVSLSKYAGMKLDDTNYVGWTRDIARYLRQTGSDGEWCITNKLGKEQFKFHKKIKEEHEEAMEPCSWKQIVERNSKSGSSSVVNNG